MKNYLLLRLKHFPEINDNEILKNNLGLYSSRNQIFFTHDDRLQRMDFDIQPPVPDIDSLADGLLMQTIGPIIDLSPSFHLIQIPNKESVQVLYNFKTIDGFFSFLFHLALASCYFIFNYVTFFKDPEPQVVEISFGLSNQITQSRPEQDLKQPNGQTEATKTIDDLPQLPKDRAPDTAPKPSESDANQLSNKADHLTFQDKNHPKSNEQSKKQEDSHKPIGPQLDVNKSSMSEKDYLKRKEEDLRKIGAKNQQGVHGKDVTKPDGQKSSLSTLPKSPFQNSESIPQSPPGLTPAGEEKGTNVANYNAYRSYLKSQLKLNWKANEGMSFPKNLKATLEFTVNPFGYLLGVPKVLKSSGNKEFDDFALQALKSTFPVGSPPPKEINPPKTFKANYNANDVE